MVLESTTYPGHHPRAPAPDPRGVRAGRRARLPPRLLAGAHRSRAHRPHDPHHAEGRRRAHRGVPPPRRGALPPDLRRGRRGLHARGRGAHQAAREHLPLGQHRARQRARAALRPDGDRRLGGRRRRGDQAVRLHALRPGPGHGRPLPAGRSVLPRVQGARARLLHRVHRAGREAQPGAAAVLRREDRARAERRRQAGARARASCCSASPTRPASATCARRRR